MYDPTVGEFIEEDPIGFDGGDENLYRYVDNSPMMATDVTGMQSVSGTIEIPLHKERPAPIEPIAPLQRANGDLKWLADRWREIQAFKTGPSRRSDKDEIVKEAEKRFNLYARQIAGYYQRGCPDFQMEAALKDFGSHVGELDAIDDRIQHARNVEEIAKFATERSLAQNAVARSFFDIVETRFGATPTLKDRLADDAQSIVYDWQEMAKAGPGGSATPQRALPSGDNSQVGENNSKTPTQALGDIGSKVGLDVLKKGYKDKYGIGGIGSDSLDRVLRRSPQNEASRYWAGKMSPQRRFDLPNPSASKLTSHGPDWRMDKDLLDCGIHLVDPSDTTPRKHDE